MNEGSYLGQKRQALLERRSSKTKILKEGGQQALSHSWNDITRIDFALRRIEQGQYGLCCNCGVPIDEGRLVSIPETPFCTDCAQSRAN
jgi:RNA polymerase-binding transcription factor DksA